MVFNLFHSATHFAIRHNQTTPFQNYELLNTCNAVAHAIAAIKMTNASIVISPVEERLNKFIHIMAAALMRWLVLHFGDKLVNEWLSCGQSTSQIWLYYCISLFLALFYIPSNAEKPASHNQVDGKGIKSRIAVLATLGYEASMADQYAGKDFSLKASSAVE